MGVQFKGIPFVDVVPKYEIKSQIIYMDFGEPFGVIAMPLHVFKRGHAKSAKVIEAYEARKGRVIEFRREYPRNKPE